jgi:hypothetical protein
VTDGCSLASIAQMPRNQDPEPMPQKQSNDIEAVPATPVEKAASAAERAVEESGEASFPASDPPSSWTWDVAGQPPGFAKR